MVEKTEEKKGERKGLYSPKVMELFLHPHNAGELLDADGIGEVGNVVCGDLLRLFIKVENDRVVDIKFLTFGCASAIATSSMITDLAKGKTLDEALKITRQNVANELGGLPIVKMHCSNLAADALHEAVYDYLKRKGKTIPPELEKEHERHVNEAKSGEAHEHEEAGHE